MRSRLSTTSSCSNLHRFPSLACLNEQLVRWTEYWRAVLGLVIVGLVLAFPQGIAGFVQERWERRR